MKVVGTRRIAEKLMQIMEIRRAASMVNTVVSNGVTDNSIIPADITALRQDATGIQIGMIKDGVKISVDQVMLILMMEDILKPYLEPELLDYFMDRIADESRIFNVEEFNENPYIKNIDFKNKQQGDFELGYDSYMPYEISFYNVPKRIDQINIDIPRVCCFTDKFEYPAIYQKSIKSTWMSVTPNEVFTMEREINRAKGKVLTLGCGMGYFAYMVSMKDEVESVTIIELEQSVVDLFETYILPQFEHREKVKVIKADAIEYVRSIEDGEYDYCFADIWLGIQDINPYFAVKEVCRKWRKTKIDYWIEESFAILLSNSVWIEMLQGFSDANSIDIPPVDYMFTEDEQRKAKYIHKLMEDEEITKPEHIDYYLNPKNIIDMINRTELIF